MTSHLPESLAESWRPLGTRTGESSVLLASITAETTLYEPIEWAEQLSRLGASEIPARSLFAVDVTVSPSLSDLGLSPDAVFSKAAPKAKTQFIETLEDEGLSVDDTRKTLEFEAANGAAGAWFVLDATYPVAPDLTANGDGTERIGTEAHVAIWPTDESYGMAGGTLPLEDVTEAIDENAAVDVAELTDGFAADPERDRETVAELIRTIDFGTGAESAE
ncbi:hypothetical protein GS429_04715 [Natronorubrum sp. JWXQ-INN-674]|uniref:Uncharacterized protein n=1 Tax=Natronorubrum halalkaliphilum TaxID=2691917 RepID=A0A6B0VK49_9EURY|nr:hypothetical protein [Natronorubrum halalkaliphilum]MXV61376.1 hypothetical protein [Natronorubrum halalkaliphilum]